MLAVWLVLPGLHAALGGDFVISRAAPAFLMGRLSETGILEKFLDRNCDDQQAYSLCAYRDSLPTTASGFMWNTRSPMNLTSGWNAHLDEYRSVIGQVLTTPRYYSYLASESVQATFRQLTHALHSTGAPPACGVDTPPYTQVQQFKNGYEVKEYLSSMQNLRQLDFTALNERLPVIHVLSLIALLIGLAQPGIRRAVGPTGIMLLVLVGLMLVANAFVTGNLANVPDRLQVRMAWLLPFAALLLVVQHGPDVVVAGLRRCWAAAGQA